MNTRNSPQGPRCYLLRPSPRLVFTAALLPAGLSSLLRPTRRKPNLIPPRSCASSGTPPPPGSAAASGPTTNFITRTTTELPFLKSTSSRKSPPHPNRAIRKSVITSSAVPWTKAAGDFSSTQGQVLYVPDRPLANRSGDADQPNEGVGVDRVTIIEMANNCFTEKPEPPWWGGFRPEPSAAGWLKAAGRGNSASRWRSPAGTAVGPTPD